LISQIVRIVELTGWMALAAAMFVQLPASWTESLPSAVTHPIELLCELALASTLFGFLVALILVWCTTKFTPRAWRESMERVPPDTRLDALVSCLAWLGALLGAAFAPTGFG
jgi:hypothetical protein